MINNFFFFFLIFFAGSHGQARGMYCPFSTNLPSTLVMRAGIHEVEKLSPLIPLFRSRGNHPGTFVGR